MTQYLRRKKSLSQFQTINHSFLLSSVLQENMTSVASGDEEKFAIISQAIQKDEKIFRLNDKILEHDKVGISYLGLLELAHFTSLGVTKQL